MKVVYNQSDYPSRAESVWPETALSSSESVRPNCGLADPISGSLGNHDDDGNKNVTNMHI